MHVFAACVARARASIHSSRVVKVRRPVIPGADWTASSLYRRVEVGPFSAFAMRTVVDGERHPDVTAHVRLGRLGISCSYSYEDSYVMAHTANITWPTGTGRYFGVSFSWPQREVHGEDQDA